MSNKILIKNLIREKILTPKNLRMLNESFVQNKTIINVDIQPEYESYISFNIYQWVQFINESSENNKVIFLYNGYDTLGMISENEYFNWLYELGIDEDVLNNAIFYDKGYAFFRNCMVGIGEDDIAIFVRYMNEKGINDSRDMEEENWIDFEESTGNEDSEIRQLLEDSDDSINIPDLMDFIKNFSNIVLTGGGINECLKEVEIALLALNQNFNILSEYTY